MFKSHFTCSNFVSNYDTSITAEKPLSVNNIWEIFELDIYSGLIDLYYFSL